MYVCVSVFNSFSQECMCVHERTTLYFIDSSPTTEFYSHTYNVQSPCPVSSCCTDILFYQHDCVCVCVCVQYINCFGQTLTTFTSARPHTGVSCYLYHRDYCFVANALLIILHQFILSVNCLKCEKQDACSDASGLFLDSFEPVWCAGRAG